MQKWRVRYRIVDRERLNIHRNMKRKRRGKEYKKRIGNYPDIMQVERKRKKGKERERERKQIKGKRKKANNQLREKKRVRVEREGERESGGEREKELSCKKKWSVINFLQNESWSPKLKIEETEKNVNEDDQRTEKQLLLASTKNAFLWSREKLESTKRSKLKWTEIQGIAL